MKFKKGDEVEVTEGEHKGKKGTVEHARAATKTVTVRIGAEAVGVPADSLKAAKAAK